MSTNFRSKSILGNINAGSEQQLLGWWNAGLDCKKQGMEAKEYGDKSHSGTCWTASTITRYVEYVLWAMENGYKRSEFRSMGHLRDTRYPKSNDKKQTTRKLSPAKKAESLVKSLRNDYSPSQIEEMGRALIALARVNK